MDSLRVNNHTPLQSTTSSVAVDSKHQMSFFVNPTVTAIFAALHPRKPRQQTTLAALITLVFLTTYIFIANSTSLFQSALGHPEPPPFDSLTDALEMMKNSRFMEDHRLAHQKPPNRPPLRLDVHQELAAVSSFLASLPQNIIPPTVDPGSPIDPQLVLDFDTTGPRAIEELNAMIHDVWSRNPVFLYSKVRGFRYTFSSRQRLRSVLFPVLLSTFTGGESDALEPQPQPISDNYRSRYPRRHRGPYPDARTIDLSPRTPYPYCRRRSCRLITGDSRAR